MLKVSSYELETMIKKFKGVFVEGEVNLQGVVNFKEGGEFYGGDEFYSGWWNLQGVGEV